MLLKCEFEGEDAGNFNVTQCFLPKVDQCEGDWMQNFTIFDGLPREINTIPDINGDQYCCYNKDVKGNPDPHKICNWNNTQLFAGQDNTYEHSVGKTGFLCQYLIDYEEMYPDSRDDYQFKNYSISVTYNQLRSGLKSLDGLLDPETNLPWYDTGRQWPKQSECSYGSAMDQMTMTYISFTGYLR